MIDLNLHVIHQTPIIRNNCINNELFKIMILAGWVFIDQMNVAWRGKCTCFCASCTYICAMGNEFQL